MIALENVSKKYIRQSALNHISFSVPIGKIVGIVGENGSGKSTLLKLMAGLSQPTSGSVTINGEPAHRRMSKAVSYLSELDAYYAMHSVREAIAFQASQFADFNLAKAEEIMKFMQLDPEKRVKQLSKGNRGRFKILLALARDVPYILMDEPLSGLDPMVRDAIIKGMISYVDLESQTLIMSSHEISEIEGILDRFIALKEGEILRMADVEALHEADGLGIAEWMKQAYSK